jgi:hypothetical protein
LAKRFTLAEAESLIPELERLMRQAVDSKPEYDETERSMRAFAERVMLMGGVNVDREEARAAKTRRDAVTTRLRETIGQVQEMGCIVKDLDMGLVDFPTLYRGRDVYLCWKLGEPSIGFWHGVEDGFAGRKPIDQDFRENHRGDPEQ